MAIKELVHYSCRVIGNVQGVGFRATTCRVAKSFAVTGLVRNEPDGTVNIEVEGEKDDLIAFLGVLKKCMASNIAAMEINKHHPKHYQGFVIDY